jgi:mono/diheme cytochrome c family protein
MNRRSSLAVLLCLPAMGSASAANYPPGKALFEHHCAVGHAAGPGHAGTMRLAELRAPANAVLEQRTDLAPAYVRQVVRQGLVEMPPWRPSEIDDAALNQIAQYLAHGRRAP